MQPTGIKSAQLLMEVVAGAQDKIAQEISKSNFSQQLSEQRQLRQNTPYAQIEGMSNQANPSQNPSATLRAVPSLLSSGIGAKISEQSSNCGNKVACVAPNSASASDLATSKWKIANELTFTDSMALEKVLTRFHLAPSVRAEIKNAVDDQGQISLDKLSEILDRAVSSKSDLPADGKAAADEIQSLLAGMVQQQDCSVQNLQQLGVRLKGSYDLGEFRELLRSLVDKTASGRLDQAGRSSLKRTTETSFALDNSAANATSRARLPNQTQSLTANLIPSFLGEEKDSAHGANVRTSILTSPVSDGDGISKVSATASCPESNGSKESSVPAALLDSATTSDVPEQPDLVQSQSAVRAEANASLESLSKSLLQKGSALTGQVESLEHGAAVESQTASKSLDDSVKNLASLSQDHTEEQNSTGANRIAAESNAGKSSIATTSTSTEIKSNLDSLFNKETLHREASPDLRNSVDLLARSEAAGEATVGRNGAASKEVTDQAAQSTSLEASLKEALTDKITEKVAPAAHTSDQFTEHGQNQESALSFFRDGVQMMSAQAATSAQNGAEMFSYYTSSLTGELAQRIKDLYQQKGFQFTMELQPKHLGRLVVRIGTDANQVKTLISTESEQAREFLTKNASLLRQELASQGLVLEQLQIDVNSQATAQDQFFQKRSQGNRRNGGSPKPATTVKESAKSGTTKSQTGVADTLISLFV
jgi:flagellar hook-length control protein FliK